MSTDTQCIFVNFLECVQENVSDSSLSSIQQQEKKQRYTSATGRFCASSGSSSSSSVVRSQSLMYSSIADTVDPCRGSGAGSGRCELAVMGKRAALQKASPTTDTKRWDQTYPSQHPRMRTRLQSWKGRSCASCLCWPCQWLPSGEPASCSPQRRC